MRRLVFVLAVVGGLFPATTSIAGAPRRAEPAEANQEISVDFGLPASNGFGAYVQAGSEGGRNAVTLALVGRHGLVTYQTRKGVVRERSFEVGFGRLGYISFRFHPIKRVPSDRLSGCPADVEKEGFFVGTALWRGERGYASIDAHRVRGKVRIESGPKCRNRPATNRRDAKRPRHERASLHATDRRKSGTRFFLAVGDVDHHTGARHASFLAGLAEPREGMIISRYATADTRRASGFHFDHRSGTATVHPPGPFHGHASFVRHGGPRHPGRWRGDLSVPLPGHDPIRLTGPAFRAVLNHDIPYVE